VCVRERVCVCERERGRERERERGRERERERKNVTEKSSIIVLATRLRKSSKHIFNCYLCNNYNNIKSNNNIKGNNSGCQDNA